MGIDMDVTPDNTLVPCVTVQLTSMVPKESNMIAVGNFSSMVCLIQPPEIISVPQVILSY